MAVDDGTRALKRENGAGDDGSSVSITQWLPVSETFTNGDIAEWMKTNEQEEITADMIADIVKNSEQENNDDLNDAYVKKMRHTKDKFDWKKNCWIHSSTRLYTCNSDDTNTIV